MEKALRDQNMKGLTSTLERDMEAEHPEQERYLMVSQESFSLKPCSSRINSNIRNKYHHYYFVQSILVPCKCNDNAEKSPYCVNRLKISI